jgi:hypothetical protein
VAKAGLRGNPGLLRQLGATMRALPQAVQLEAARAVAPVATELTSSAFDGGQTVYGNARPAGVDGGALSLVKTGSARASLKFTADGSAIRCNLGPKHLRYLIGKYKVLPNNRIPFAWRRQFSDVVQAVARRQVAAAFAPVARKAG